MLCLEGAVHHECSTSPLDTIGTLLGPGVPFRFVPPCWCTCVLTVPRLLRYLAPRLAPHPHDTIRYLIFMSVCLCVNVYVCTAVCTSLRECCVRSKTLRNAKASGAQLFAVWFSMRMEGASRLSTSCAQVQPPAGGGGGCWQFWGLILETHPI